MPPWPEEEDEDDFALPDQEGWRGDQHLADWPEKDYEKGEYGLFKKEVEDDDLQDDKDKG